MFMGSTNICDCTVIFIEVGVITIRFSVVYTTSYMQAIFKQRKLLTCERYFSFLCSILSSLSLSVSIRFLFRCVCLIS